MESLLGKMDQGDDKEKSGSKPPRLPDVQQAHDSLNQAMGKLNADQFHSATSGALTNLSSQQRSSLSTALTQAGAAQGAGVDANASDPNAISKMLHWVQTNVPGGIPAVLAVAAAAGGTAAVAGSGQGGNLVQAAQSTATTAAQSAQESGGGLLHSVLGAIMPAINEAVSKASQ
jgi:hypothetical protein